MSSKPILYYMEMSPPARAVLHTADQLGIELELKVLNLMAGEHMTPEYLRLNPQHTIPLLDDNGVIISDSHAICSYLVQKHAGDASDPNSALYPLHDIVRRAKIAALLHFDSGVLFARMRFIFEGVIYHGQTKLDEDRVAGLAKGWAMLEGFLESGRYLVGDELSIADICCISTIGSYDEIIPLDEAVYPKVAAWRQRMVAMPFYVRYSSVHARSAQAFVKSKLVE